ncbi:hypothetical protein [Nocardia acidivorans]|uniref:hypothetical protein n=1 Tax=Nocardia acidivorans TaxID=404580 RepID=UPI00083049B8|nr:hypothetical protein [Nocardia acidivorans]
MADTSGVPMTDAEVKQFYRLLQRWCETELDQFAHLIVPTRWGDVYAHFGRARPEDESAECYERLRADWLGESE